MSVLWRMEIETNVLKTLTTLFTSVPVQHLYLALSGGVDSCVLLDILASWVQSQKYLQLSAIHVHHGLSPQADAWVLHCMEICERYQVPCQIERVAADKSRNVEENARKLRYGVFKNYIHTATDCLLTAHHQDDQVETMLLQLLRGTGTKGLSGMLPVSPFSAGFLVRPFLDFSREELVAYANHRQLKWVEDESNANIAFDRNYLRSQVIPVLKNRWPALNKTMGRAARHCQETQLFLDEIMAHYFERAKTEQQSVIKCQPLLELSDREQRFLVRYWLQSQGVQSPAEVILVEIQKMFHARMDAMPKVCFGRHEIRRYQDCLYLLARTTHPAPHESVHVWDFPNDLVLPQVGVLRAEIHQGSGLTAPEPNTQVTVRFRCGGEKIQPAGRLYHHTLKNLFQEWKVPVWQRDYVPLVYYDDELVCVVGYCVAQNAIEKVQGYELRLVK